MNDLYRCVRGCLRGAAPLLFAVAAFAQEHDAPTESPTMASPVSAAAPAPLDKRVFGVLPNYRTADGSIPFVRITAKQKFIIASKDSFDYPVFMTTAFFAGLSQLQGTDNEVYGQGLKGFSRRYGINYADQVLNNYFPEAIIPALLHMDPRYFRKGTGTVKGRLLYAVTRSFICKTDSGKETVNLPELLGNAMGVAIASSYHPHQRTLGDMANQYGSILEVDMLGEVTKEFWPDIKRALSKHHPSPTP